jgi:hypothetical protein
MMVVTTAIVPAKECVILEYPKQTYFQLNLWFNGWWYYLGLILAQRRKTTR